MGEPNSSPHMASSIGSSSNQAASGELEIPQPVTNNPNREDIIMQRIAGLDATMQRVCGVLSSISSQPGLSQGDQTAPSLPVSSVLQSNPSPLAGGPISSPTVGQVHPATAPAFVPLAQNQYAQGTPLPAQSVLNTVLPQFRLGQNCMGSGALPTVPIPSLPVSPTLPPVPGYLVEKIAKGQFVDFGLLRPGNLKKLPVDEPTQVQMAKLFRGNCCPSVIFQTGRRHVLSIVQWWLRNFPARSKTTLPIFYSCHLPIVRCLVLGGWIMTLLSGSLQPRNHPQFGGRSCLHYG